MVSREGERKTSYCALVLSEILIFLVHSSEADEPQTVPRWWIHNDAVKKRFEVHALNNDDWSLRFLRNERAQSDWIAPELEVIGNGRDWLKPRRDVVRERVQGRCASFQR